MTEKLLGRDRETTDNVLYAIIRFFLHIKHLWKLEQLYLVMTSVAS